MLFWGVHDPLEQIRGKRGGNPVVLVGPLALASAKHSSLVKSRPLPRDLASIVCQNTMTMHFDKLTLELNDETSVVKALTFLCLLKLVSHLCKVPVATCFLQF